MRGYYVKNIGLNRGKPRIWLQGGEVANAGLTPGARYDIHVNGGTVVLRANPDGSRVVSSKAKGEDALPIIDINSKELLALFDGMSAVRLVQREGEIYLLPLATELRKKERLTRLRRKIENGEPIKTGAVCFGGGILTHALHKGLEKGGIKSELAFAAEIRPELLQHAMKANSAWGKDTIPLAAPIQELAFDPAAMEHIPRIDIAELGLACSGASISGRAKRGTDKPEDHPEVGHLVVPALIILGKGNPAIIEFENVVPYASSASASILRNQLRDLGYDTYETIIAGSDFNAHEDRKRWVMVAVTKGLSFSWDMMQFPEKKESPLKDILDQVPVDDPMWSSMSGLKAKEARNAAEGNCFKMQVVSEDDTQVGTITKGYARVRSTDWKLAHPTTPNLLRQFTVSEHARLKQIPEGLIEGLAQTVAHEVLGQSVVYEPFVEIGRMIADTITNFAEGRAPQSMPELVEMIAAEFTDSASQVVSEIRKPMVGVVYEGPITVNDLGMVVQNIGNGVGILHHRDTLKSDLIEDVKLGESVRIQYPSSRQAPRVTSLSETPPSISPELSKAMATASRQAPTQDNGPQLDIFSQPADLPEAAPRKTSSPRMG